MEEGVGGGCVGALEEPPGEVEEGEGEDGGPEADDLAEGEPVFNEGAEGVEEVAAEPDLAGGGDEGLAEGGEGWVIEDGDGDEGVVVEEGELLPGFAAGEEPLF